jgi:hypothetical protein
VLFLIPIGSGIASVRKRRLMQSTMSTKSRQTIWGGSIMGAKIRAEGARKRATEAIREADRAECEAWSVRMEGYGGPAQPSPTIGQCINGGLGWLASDARHARAFRLMRSVARVARRSGSLRRR